MAPDYLPDDHAAGRVLDEAARLRGSEARLERAVRGCADGLWEHDLVSGRLWTSARVGELLGEDAAAGGANRSLHHYLRRVHPAHRQQVRQALQAQQQGGPVLDVVIQLRVGELAYRWFRVRGERSGWAGDTAARVSGSLTDVHEWQCALQRLEWQILHDPLTSLSNRALFMDRVARLLAQDQGHTHAAVFAMDFDRFKQVNDVYGHGVGDELLRAIGDRLREETSGAELACRFGGDEFAVLLPAVESPQRARLRAERLHAALSRPYRLHNGLELLIAASIGVLYIDSNEYGTAEAVLRDADAAMYQAKASGGRVQFFDGCLRERMIRTAALEHDLRHCVANDELTLLYQPIVSLDTGKIECVEALVRWQRPGTQELIAAGEFIPLAEETGLIVSLGRWVVAQACAELRTIRAMQPPGTAIQMAINVSRRELVEPDYVETLLQTVRRHGLQPGDLMLEITETAFVDSRYDIAAIAETLRAAGFVLALDDFGTGQSSLNSLQELPIAVVKIDKKFVRELSSRQSVIAIVHAIVTLGHHLGLRVIAEGVESESEVGALQGMECAMGQGYFFSRPVTLEALLQLQRKQSVWRRSLNDQGRMWGHVRVATSTQPTTLWDQPAGERQS
jgi:diguanylate cyclase (GGDEF)-like protein